MKPVTCGTSRSRLIPPIVLTLLTLSSPAIAVSNESNESNASESLEASGTIDFPEGRNVASEKCFDLEGYKSLAIIYGRYSHCEAQKHYVLDLVAAVDAKQNALEEASLDLTLALSSLEAERKAMAAAMVAGAERTKSEAWRKRVWRGLAVGGLVVSLALGAVVLGMGVSQ